MRPDAPLKISIDGDGHDVNLTSALSTSDAVRCKCFGITLLVTANCGRSLFRSVVTFALICVYLF